MGSTYADVRRAWVDLLRLSYLPGITLSSGRVIKDKTLVHFTALKVRAVFNTGEALQPDTPVQIIGAEAGCRIRTPTGLRVGLPKREALTLASRHYLVNVRNSSVSYTFLDPVFGPGSTEIGLFFEDGLVDFIGVYRK